MAERRYAAVGKARGLAHGVAKNPDVGGGMGGGLGPFGKLTGFDAQTPFRSPSLAGARLATAGRCQPVSSTNAPTAEHAPATRYEVR